MSKWIEQEQWYELALPHMDSLLSVPSESEIVRYLREHPQVATQDYRVLMHKILVRVEKDRA